MLAETGSQHSLSSTERGERLRERGMQIAIIPVLARGETGAAASSKTAKTLWSSIY